MTITVRWPFAIVVSVAALAVATTFSPGEPVTLALTLWFLLICPGMAVVGILGLRDPWVRATAAVALSIALDVAVAGTLVYSGAWSPTVALVVLGTISIMGAGVQSRLERRSSLSRRRLVLQAVGAIVASALAGIMLGRAMEPEGAPSSVAGSGLMVQLPPGWEQATSDLGRPAISSAIAAGPPEEPESRFVAGKLSSQADGERMLEAVQREGDRRTQVQLGGLHAWRYTGLRPRPHLVGTGYLAPTTTGGAVLVICHSSEDAARIRLAECDRAAATLVVRGERPRQFSSVDRSRERLIRVIATLRSSRSEGRQRLAAAKLARGQAQAATSLQLGHERAARSLDRIATLENGRSLGNLSAALRAAAAAYGRVALAATISSRSEYREASHAVVREEEAVSRELARASSA